MNKGGNRGGRRGNRNDGGKGGHGGRQRSSGGGGHGRRHQDQRGGQQRGGGIPCVAARRAPRHGYPHQTIVASSCCRARAADAVRAPQADRWPGCAQRSLSPGAAQFRRRRRRVRRVWDEERHFRRACGLDVRRTSAGRGADSTPPYLAAPRRHARELAPRTQPKWWIRRSRRAARRARFRSSPPWRQRPCLTKASLWAWSPPSTRASRCPCASPHTSCGPHRAASQR